MGHRRVILGDLLVFEEVLDPGHAAEPAGLFDAAAEPQADAISARARMTTRSRFIDPIVALLPVPSISIRRDRAGSLASVATFPTLPRASLPHRTRPLSNPLPCLRTPSPRNPAPSPQGKNLKSNLSHTFCTAERCYGPRLIRMLGRASHTLCHNAFIATSLRVIRGDRS